MINEFSTENEVYRREFKDFYFRLILYIIFPH